MKFNLTFPLFVTQIYDLRCSIKLKRLLTEAIHIKIFFFCQTPFSMHYCHLLVIYGIVVESSVVY